MDVTENCVVASLLQGTAEQSRILEIRQPNGAITLETKMNEVEVLGDDRRRRSREIEGEGILHRSKVMKLEDQIFGKVGLVTPDDPSNSDIAQSELMSTETRVRIVNALLERG